MALNKAFFYEAFASPQQEGGEESDTPANTPAQFKSTTPSTPREQRKDRAQAVLTFSKDLSRAYFHMAIKNIDVSQINMMHIHCGKPGQLGPILIDFSLIGNLQSYFADNEIHITLYNQDITDVTDSSDGSLIDAFTVGCPILKELPQDRVKTIGGMKTIADEGQLYVNLHTTGQTYYGDVRGMFYPVAVETK
ncbi:CHRD domain-containing protein [Methylocucumis oryzae]|uniref:CHRD domain-containing protein n=1 Tax=Methylocucumis oryzae TaxID=1632867 RepID=UPI000697D235|nr:CHRD domain-containing protein [Methylocucumis oryzae]